MSKWGLWTEYKFDSTFKNQNHMIIPLSASDICKNSTFIHYKNTHQTGMEGYCHGKGNLQKT